MTRIVTSTYRYKCPPKRRKAVALEVPKVVAISDKTRKRVAKDQPSATMPSDNTSSLRQRKSAIVTARKPGKRYVDVPDMTPEEHRRRGDAADAMFREMNRWIAEKLRK